VTRATTAHHRAAMERNPIRHVDMLAVQKKA
jgi:hypothetical protein